MLFTAVLIGGFHVTLEHAEIALNWFGVNHGTTPLARTLVDELVLVTEVHGLVRSRFIIFKSQPFFPTASFISGISVFAFILSTTIERARPVLRSASASTLYLC